MSLVGAVMMLWVIDGLVQLLTGYSVFGNPLIELDSGQALVTGSLRTGYGSTLAILSPFTSKHSGARGVERSIAFWRCRCSPRS